MHERLLKYANPRLGVIGIPDQGVTHDVEEPPGKWEYLFSQHVAKRAGRHIDLRLAPNNRSHSWALRSLPGPGEKVLATRQPTHAKAYHDFQGNIPSGYGAGDVKTLKRGIAHVVEARKDKVTFNIHEGKKTHEYSLIKTHRGPKDWLLVNHSTTPGKYSFPQDKGTYRETKLDDALLSRPGTLLPKIDGAHSLIVLDPNKRPRVFSYRQSKRGDVLEYTHKIPGLFDQRVPGDFKRVVLRGETVLVDKNGRALPSEQTAALLNSGVEKALSRQGENNLRVMPFDIIGNSEPYPQRLSRMQEYARRFPQMIVPEGAHDPESKKKLIEAIRSKRHPLTAEGVVHWDEKGPTKAKVVSDKDVYITGVFPGKGKYQGSAGGFSYARTLGGSTVGKVGTGFSDKQRKKLWARRAKLHDQVARVSYDKETRKGALFGSRYLGPHVDKNL